MQRHTSLLQTDINLTHLEEFLEERKADEEKQLRVLEGEKIDRLKILEHWLSAAPIYQDHQIICAKRKEYPNTGRWIFQNSIFMKWFKIGTKSDSQLWMTAKPGRVTSLIAL
jgi:hypothetical protein